ncbi:hypothetical protein M407DRAFT_192827 [Tulasnella calospora MUT 4182]|uniref:Uncharacterized protein n=1 Tax=Tulasnella calospora MUT 4182 TaxID=1051891 RepID=A0A0C3M0V3_9AGAM|nr:hypothetical protein M407DRAFT_192827 [Tulasnella calospora MUT 4182]
MDCQELARTRSKWKAVQLTSVGAPQPPSPLLPSQHALPVLPTTDHGHATGVYVVELVTVGKVGEPDSSDSIIRSPRQFTSAQFLRVDAFEAPRRSPSLLLSITPPVICGVLYTT